MTPRSSWFFLIFISLSAYAGMVNGTFLSLDESEILRDLDRASLNIRDYFLPVEGGTHLYYRPVQGLSLLADRLIWGTQASGLHLTNILLHMTNVLLVYMLAFKVTSGAHRPTVAFLAALIFAVHPIHTEAVDWIAGRTDLLATLFGLLSLLAYIRFRADLAWPYLVVSVGCYLLSLFSKEVGLSIPLVILAFEWTLHRHEATAKRLRLAWWGTGAFGVSTVCYLLLRKAALSAGDVGMEKSIGALDVSWLSQAKTLFSAVGFYVRKLIQPFPLNFAIGPVDSGLYLFLGLLVLAAVCVAIFKTGEMAFWVWWTLLTLLPSLVVALAGMAWTSVAERYLYLPSVGFSILAVLLLSALFARVSRPTAVLGAVTLAVCGVFFVATYSRNLIWQEPKLLWQDTVKKSPGFPIAHNEYGIALMSEKRYDEAKAQFEEAIRLGYRAKPLENLAMMAAFIDSDHQQAEALLKQAIDDGGPQGRLYSRLATTYVRRASQESNSTSRELLRTAIGLYEQAYAHQGDPVVLYRIGQLYLRIGEYGEARVFFERAIDQGHPKDFFVAPSKAIVLKLSSRHG